MMFSEWSSDLLPQQGWLGDQAAISAFKNAVPWKVSRDFVAGTAKHLAGGLGGQSKPPSGAAAASLSPPHQPCAITHDKQLSIIMPALGYGLSFPLSEVDVLRDCVTVYCDWLTAFLPHPKPSVPQPIIDDPNHYAAIIISHFYYVFVPRGGEVCGSCTTGAEVNKQAVLCHRVLRMLQTVAQSSNTMTEETWHTLLLFLLHINSALLAPPTVKDDAGEQLCERVLSVLFETWLLACDKCFPPPPLWTALRQGCIEWRHRIGLVQQWGRICCALTARLLNFLYGPHYQHKLASSEEQSIIPSSMTHDCTAQVWFRLLHILGNPVELSKHEVISKTPAFLKFAISSQAVVEPCQHPCLNALPQIFLAAVKVIARLVDAFIGGEDGSSEAVVGRAKVNSVLHLFGPWLFEAALINTELSPSPAQHHKSETTSSVSGVINTGGSSIASSNNINNNASTTSSSTSAVRTGSVSTGSSSSTATSGATSGGKRPVSTYGHVGESRKSSSSDTVNSSFTGAAPFAAAAADERLASLSPADFEAGRAEALGALCRIFSSAKTREEILPVYLSRFYLAVREGLRSPSADPAKKTTQPTKGESSSGAGVCSESAAAVLLHGCDLFRIDLDGVITLVPSILPVLTTILADRTARDDKNIDKVQSVTSVTALRRAATNILLSLLALPLHFQDLTVKEVGINGERHKVSSLRPQLLHLLSVALQTETQPQTTHMLLGGLMFCVQDASVCEAMDSVSQHNYPTSDNRDTNTPLGGESCSSVCGGMADLSSLTEESLDDIALNSGTGVTDQYHAVQQITASVATTGTAPLALLTASAAAATAAAGSGHLGSFSHMPMSVSAHDCGSTLVVRAIYLVCHHLILSWRTDVNVSLAGLELLAGLARLHTPHQDWLECKRAVKWLCDYIVYQCSRPPQAHSKDLHSTIVAAFHTCSVWLMSQPSLLQDHECLATLLEVIELGISGAKSQSKGGVILKHEKQLKPASLRVRDAAEALLSCVLSQVGRFPVSCGAELVSSQLDETTLLQHCNTWQGDEHVSRDTATKHFRYYVSQNSILLALLEQPLGNNQEPQPSVTAILRGPFGRSVWSMQLRHLPRHRSASTHHTSNPGRPLPVTDVALNSHTTPRPAPRYFPDSVDRIPLCKADKSIPSLDSVIHSTEKSSAEHEKLLQILDHQLAFEEQLVAKASAACEGRDDGEGECVAPPVCQEFQTARLLLTHLGLLSVESLQCKGEGSIPELVALDSSTAEFVKDLDFLDATNNRSVDTVHLFYVAQGHTQPHQILENTVSNSSVSSHFMELIGGLGWPVNVASHTGWTGRTRHLQQHYTSQQVGLKCDGGGEYSGASQVVYWCDASTEVAFLVPTQHHHAAPAAAPTHPVSHNTALHSGGGGLVLEGDNASTGGDSVNTAGAADGADTDATSSFSSHTSQASQVSSGRRFGRQSSAVVGYDHKVMVVWLENYADYRAFPTGSLLSECVTGLESPGWRERDPVSVSIIFIHPLESGLFRVKLHASANKLSIAGPLVEGQVVSRRVLGALVRQTALNMARRRRLDCDSYQPPHVRRKLRIQDMVQKYRYDMTEPEFYSHLFTSPLC